MAATPPPSQPVSGLKLGIVRLGRAAGKVRIGRGNIERCVRVGVLVVQRDVWFGENLHAGTHWWHGRGLGCD